MSLVEVLQLLRSGWDLAAESDEVRALAGRLSSAGSDANALRPVLQQLAGVGLEDGAVERAFAAALAAWSGGLEAAGAAAKRAYVEATVPRSLSLRCPRCGTPYVMERRDSAMGITGLALSCVLCGLNEDAVDDGMRQLRERWQARG